MGDKSDIEWLLGPDGRKGATWNFVTGCTRVSEGCRNCYLPRTMPFRVAGRRFNGSEPGATTGVVLHPERLDMPLKKRDSIRIFANSLSDLWHKDVPMELVAKGFAVMAMTPQHTYMIPTKRPGPMRAMLSSDDFWLAVGEAGKEITAARAQGKYRSASPMHLTEGSSADGQWMPVRPLRNVQIGVSVEDQATADLRIPTLLATPYIAVRWVSAEPLLGPIDLSQWLPKEETCGCADVQGARGISSRGVRGTDHRLAGPDLASGSQARQSMDGGQSSGPVHSSQSGARHADIPASAGDVRGQADTRDGAPAGVASSERPDSSRAHREPHERDQDRQPPVQPGVSDASGAGRTRPHDPPAGEARPVRSAELEHKADDGAGAENLLASGGRRASACPRCGVRSSGTDDLADSPGRETLLWVVAGGESGPGARPMHPAWVRSLRDQCVSAGVPYFMKQWGEWRPQPSYATDDRHHVVMLDGRDRGTPWPGWHIDQPDAEVMERVGKHNAGAELDGRTWTEYPDA